MKSVEYLEKLQYDLRLNDTKVAILLNKSKAAISQYKSGVRVMDEETCLALALALNEDPMKIIAAAGIERAEKTGQKSLWEVFMKGTQMVKTASVSAALCLSLVTNLLTAEEAKATPALSLQKNKINSLYIMSNWVLGMIRRISRVISTAKFTTSPIFTSLSTAM